MDYSKFELPHRDSVNIVEIGIDISDVLRINDKVITIFIFEEMFPKLKVPDPYFRYEEIFRMLIF